MSQLVETKPVLKVLSIKELCVLKGFVTLVPSVRSNTNDYPYITFINAKNEAENIYFSKAASANVTLGSPVDKAMLATHQAAFTKNEAGEDRIKLISNSERVDISSLLD